jgi:hypothetical protein
MVRELTSSGYRRAISDIGKFVRELREVKPASPDNGKIIVIVQLQK